MSFQIRRGLLDPFTRSRLHATPKSKLLLFPLMLSRLLSLLPCPPGLPLPVRRRGEGVWRTLSAGLSETWLSPVDVGCHPQVTEPGALPIRMLSPGAGRSSHASRPASPLPGARRPLQLLGDHGAGWPHRPGTRAPRVPRCPRGLTAPAAKGAAEPAGERGAESGGAGRLGRPGERRSPVLTREHGAHNCLRRRAGSRLPAPLPPGDEKRATPPSQSRFRTGGFRNAALWEMARPRGAFPTPRLRACADCPSRLRVIDCGVV